ncbi:cell wall hydrolase [Parvibaculum sp.]|jgi:spore germination cell wall hydrolase CwlJ-like protein|uniref:cell wall hydrolase n=1 Tax=Parvibaculum sp. TaxID=2024848 RepID=UPI001B1BDF1B|nr:cell wall hydrolase [Parvibaculum sp.]MBO6633560.1 cell wall hydrolase [Parvibaculum sp.]MBO6678450.1 cell wall hydrolase [Parvibaculum sp.]MBO6686234.1 cell wall hydrolase [Parvibaculum sp.]MBO6905588.1 cell wall hydrolase [Parvibaculum sp.]
MRRLFQWLDLGHLVAGAAQTAAAVLCLGVVSTTVLSAMTTPDPVVAVRKSSLPMTAYAPSHGRDLAGAFGGDSAFLDAQVEKASITMPAPGVPMDVDTPLVRLKAQLLEEERRCLAAGIYFEARGETTEGQLAVARVILNRVGSEHYPDSICGVVYQGASRATGCQFSFTCDKRVNKVPNERRAWAKARRTAEYVTLGRIGETELAPAMFYHADYVQPYWAASMVEVAKIGRHIFYKPRREGRS